MKRTYSLLFELKQIQKQIDNTEKEKRICELKIKKLEEIKKDLVSRIGGEESGQAD